jgi:glycosyltransferase involved in cell wall biosynthesis
MNIGIFLPDIRPDRGGAFTFVETAVAGLLESGSDDAIVVFHYGASGDLAQHFAGKRVAFHSLAASSLGRIAKKVWFGEVTARLQAPLNLVSRVLERALPYPAGSPLDRAARQRAIDLMLFPTPMFERVDIPYAVTIWDLEHRAHPYFPELAAHGEWGAREHYFTAALRRASYIITGTAVGRDEIVRFYGVDAGRVRVLPHPTPAFALAAANGTPPALKLPVARPYVLYPAQFWSHKNHVGLLRGLAELQRRGVTVDCALVGADKGNLGYVRERAAELGIADRVHVLGFVDRDELVALYRNAAALVYTSLCGPENLPPLEAMALGCPVIASDIPGAREQLGDAAVLVDALDPIALADAIERVLTSAEHRQQLQNLGRARAARYTQLEFGRDLHAMIEEFRRRRDLWEHGD